MTKFLDPSVLPRLQRQYQHVLAHFMHWLTYGLFDYREALLSGQEPMMCGNAMLQSKLAEVTIEKKKMKSSS